MHMHEYMHIYKHSYIHIARNTCINKNVILLILTVIIIISFSGITGTKETRPKSATKKRDGNISSSNSRNSNSNDVRDDLYPKKSNEELYPTARGLIRK